MTWTRLSDDWTDLPVMFELDRDARFLWVELMVWSNRMLTDGMIPANAVRRISDSQDIDGALKQLIDNGVMYVDDDGAYQLDWTDQEAADQVKARQVANAAKQNRYRDRKARHDRGDHSACDARWCRAAMSVTGNATGGVTSDVTPTRPDPSRPVPTARKGQGQGPGSAPSAGAPDARQRNDAWDHSAPCSLRAHQFISDDAGHCSHEDLIQGTSETAICGQPYSCPAHGHEFDPVCDGAQVCARCGVQERHAVHFLTTPKPYWT